MRKQACTLFILAVVASSFPAQPQRAGDAQEAARQPLVCGTIDDCYARGRESYKNRDFRQAIPFYESGIHLAETQRISPDTRADLHNSLGRSYYSIQEYKRALTPLQHAVKLKPDGPGYQGNLAAVLYELEDHNGARSAATACIEQYPPAPIDLARCHFIRGKTWFSRDPAMALKDAEQAVAISQNATPDKKPLVDYVVFLAQVQSRLCRPADAEKTLHIANARASDSDRKRLALDKVRLSPGANCASPSGSARP